MSHDPNTDLIERYFEVIDDLQKYAREAAEKAYQENDLETLHAILENHERYEEFREIMDDRIRETANDVKAEIGDIY